MYPTRRNTGGPSATAPSEIGGRFLRLNSAHTDKAVKAIDTFAQIDIAVRSRLIVGPLLEELRLPLVPALEGVVRRPALQDGLR